MKYDVTQKHSVVVIAPEGELDVSNVPELQQAFHQIVNDGSKKVVFDLNNVTYMDSSALGVLVSGLKELRKINGTLKIANLSGNVERIFKLTRLIKFFETYASTDQAVMAFN